MNGAPFFSIIIPVYNTVPYLSACVESVLSQGYSDFELILIDDGSADGSADLCDAFAGRDARVRVIHQANAGVSSARNRGLDCAKGEYLWFCDSDDVVLPDALQTLYSCLEQCGAAMVVFPLEQVDCSGNKVGLIPAPEPSKDAARGPLQCGDPLYPQARVFKRELARGERFDTSLALLEDRDYFYRIAWKAAGHTAVIDEPLYRYLVTREDSAVNTPSAGKLLGAARVQYEILLNEVSLGHPMPAFWHFAENAASTLVFFARNGSDRASYDTVRARMVEQKGCLSHLSGALKTKYLLAVYFPGVFNALARMTAKAKRLLGGRWG